MVKFSFAASAVVMSLFAIAAMFTDTGGAGVVYFGAISAFIPQVWSARLLQAFRRARRWRRAVTDVSDEIRRQGDTIHVGEIVSSVTIRAYDKTRDIEAPELQTDYDDTFSVDQGNYFNIGVNDVDRVQSQPALLPRFTDEAGYALALEHDAFVRSLFIGSGQNGFETTNPNGKAKASADANTLKRQRLVIAGIQDGGLAGYADEAAYTTACEQFAHDLFFLQRILLDKDWPLAGEDTGGEGGEGAGPTPYAICNTKTYEALTWFLLQMDNGSGVVQDAAVRGGFIRQLFGLDIRPDRGMSNANAATNGVGRVQIAIGMNAGIYLAEQIRQTEAYRPEKRFQDAVKGLSVYGGKRVDATKLFAVVQADGNKVGVQDVNGDA